MEQTKGMTVKKATSAIKVNWRNLDTVGKEKYM